MAVLGIDPGSRRCGYGVVARCGTGLSRLSSGVLVPGGAAAPERLGRILVSLSEIIERGGIEAVAVESVFCGRSPRSALMLGQARGVALAVAARAGLPVFEYAPTEVKRAFTGNGRAEKAQMVRTARTLFGIAPAQADEADALAVAVCHLARRHPGAAAAHPGAPRRRGVLRPSVRRFDEGP